MKNYLILFVVLLSACTQQPNFKTFPKIDAHVHVETFDDSFMEVINENNLRVLTIAYDASSQSNIDRQFNYSIALNKKHAKAISFATTFSMEGFGESDWQEKTIKILKENFDNGAIAVKVWKDIGMTFRNPDSSFIFIDDVRLDPIWNFIESQNKTLVNHTAEPKNCWLPFEEMTVKGDSGYYAEHPQYHMYMHPGYPKYEEILAARNRMLDKHTKLRYVACHLGSQEWSVEEQADFLDMYPNASLDMASRIDHFKYQDRDKVRSFIIKYQDRLLYGTDIEIVELDSGRSTADEMLKYIEEVYINDWEYFTTEDTFTQDEKVKEYIGLNLPLQVLEKIYYNNAVRMYPGLEVN